VQPVVEHWVRDPVWLDVGQFSGVAEEYALVEHGGPHGVMVLVDAWPGSWRGVVHDHCTWAVVGCAHGVEQHRFWRRVDDGHGPGPCRMERGTDLVARAGQVLAMGSEAIHEVDNLAPAGEVSVSLHVYGADLRNTHRLLYDPEAGVAAPHPNDEFVDDN
jgi:predicted metal-dependent enzyme (double-stranded beta helix superfamily)